MPTLKASGAASLARREPKGRSPTNRPILATKACSVPADPTPPSHEGATIPSLPLPMRLGTFRLEEVLAHGGSATVYAATDTRGAPATVKVLHTRIHEPGVRARFEREASIRIAHPNIVNVLGAGVAEGGIAWIAMERLHGEPLAKHLGRGPLPVREAVSLAVQAARGMEAAHAEGIVHRDLKPENLFLCEDGTLKVLDFGIALHQDGGTRLTTTGVVLGTPWYLAPEQAMGKERLDTRVDVWALGAVLYEMLCGKSPFERESPIATVVAILHDPLEPLRVLAPHVAPEVAAVVERCLEKDPAQRWTSMEALRCALEQLDIPHETSPPPGPLPSLRPGEAPLGAVLWMELPDEETARARARTIVEQWGGAFLPVEGGGFLAFFGGEHARGDEARRAAEVALRLGVRRAALSVDRLEAFRATLRGPALDRARRAALSAAGDGCIIVDSEAVPMLGGRFILEYTEQGCVLLERRATTSRPPAQLSDRTERIADTVGEAAFTLSIGREPPLVGRNVEKARLSEAIEQLFEERRANAVLLCGPPGIGKRRLRRELQRMLRGAPEPVLVLRGSAEGRPGRRSFGLFAEALRRHAQRRSARDGWPSLAPSASPSERFQAIEHLVESSLGPSDPALERTATFLGVLLELPVPETPALRLAREDRQVLEDQIRQALDRLLEGWLRQQPVALLFDHLQWADPASVEAFETFLERFAHDPLLLVATVRPELREARPQWLAGLPAEWIELRGLSRRHVARLAASVAGRPLPEPFVERLHAHTGGVPLFVEQIVATLRAEDALEASEALDTLPRTVEAAMQAYLDALPELVRGLCVRTALLERPFDPPLVAALGVADAPRILEQARQRGLLEARPGPDGHRLYRFRSPLAHQVARRMLDRSLRAQLAERAARAIEARDDGDAWELARLWEAAGDSREASAHYARVAEDRAVPAEQALQAAERALALGGLDAATTIRVVLARADALGHLGRNDERAELLERWIARTASPSERIRLERERAAALWHQGRHQEARDVLERLVAAPQGAMSPRDTVLARLWLTQMLAFASRFDEAARCLSEAQRLCPPDDLWLLGLLASSEGHLFAQAGRLDRALAAFDRAASALERAGDARRAVNARGNHAAALNDLGAYEQAVQTLRETMKMAARLGHLDGRAYQQANLAFALGRLGRFEAARAAAAEALRFAERRGQPLLEGMTSFYRLCIEVHAALHDRARLEGVAEEALREAQRLDDMEQPLYGALCRALAGRAWLEAGRAHKGVPHLRAAAERLETAPHAPEDPIEVLVHLARAHEALGQPEAAQKRWRAAAERLLGRAQRIDDPRWRERFLREVEAHALVVAHPEWNRTTSPGEGC